MTPKQLRRHVKRLPADTLRYRKVEQALEEGAGFGSAWYSTQKEHWLGWLQEYSGPGAYGRQVGKARSAEYVYNHIQCAPMLFWLAEALEVGSSILDEAEAAILAAPTRNAPQCAAFRRVVPWTSVEPLLLRRKSSIAGSARRWLGLGRASGTARKGAT